MPRDSTSSNNSSLETGSTVKIPTIIPVESYPQALQLLYDRIDYERIGHAPYTANHYRLDRMRQLLGLLDSPQEKYAIVHVAGTKGKGTSATLLYDALRACGRRTGLYTSPHLLRLEERIQFQGACCTEAELIDLTRTVLAASAELESRGGGRTTFFELTTAMGMLHFANQAADCVVLEVGLGGRLDSTNVCQPEACLITSISCDHQAQLGDTIDEIAREKAGIIKPGVPLVCTARHPDARAAIAEVAQQRAAPLKMLERDFSVTWQTAPFSPNTPNSPLAMVHYTSDQRESQWPTRLMGRHQADNIGGAIAVLDLLREQGWELPMEHVQSAIAQSIVAARLQIFDSQPIRIVDTAHNPASIEAGLDAIDEHFPDGERIIVFASSRDKDYPQMLRQILPRCQHLILTAYQKNPRALSSGELHAVAETLRTELRGQSPATKFAEIHHVSAPADAWQTALRLASAQDIVLATGSFFLAAELLPLLQQSLWSAK